MNNQTITFPKQTESPYKYIINLINAAKNLVNYHDRGLIFDSDKALLFITLINLERSIDSYRSLLFPGSSTDFSEDKSLVNLELEKLRSKIWEIRKNIDEQSIENILDSAGEDFKLRFRKYS